VGFAIGSGLLLLASFIAFISGGLLLLLLLLASFIAFISGGLLLLLLLSLLLPLSLLLLLGVRILPNSLTTIRVHRSTYSRGPIVVVAVIRRWVEWR